MPTNVDSKDKVAALIYFSDEVEKERVLAWVKKLQEQGHVEGFVVDKYNPYVGAPVWYVP